MEKFDTIDPLNQVAIFHKTFHHPILPEPAIPPKKRCELRIELLAEELNELKEAVQKNDLVQVADALCDLQYVLSGAVLEFGMAGKFRQLFEEVQRSNMSKACATEAEAKMTVQHYKEKNNTECYYKNSDGRFLVYRQADNKTIKSVNYSPADLESILKN